MRVLIAPDKLKASLSADLAAHALARGLLSVIPDAVLDLQPLADGGEGTMKIVTEALGGDLVARRANDPMMQLIDARIGWVSHSKTAVIELAEASGYWRVPDDNRRPWELNTFGTGELILAAKNLGANRIYVGLGGSATNDAGAGIAAALGFQFLDRYDQPVKPVPKHFLEIYHVIPQSSFPMSGFEILSDVNIPLTGPHGATHMFGPQKGVAADALEKLDEAVSHFADVVERDLGCRVKTRRGAGAAGGAGFGLMAFCGASQRAGFDVISDLTDLESRVAACDLVLTAEGSADIQTLRGKGPGALAQLAARYGKRIAMIAGKITDESDLADVFDYLEPLSRKKISLEESTRHVEELLGMAAARVAILAQGKHL